MSNMKASYGAIVMAKVIFSRESKFKVTCLKYLIASERSHHRDQKAKYESCIDYDALVMAN